MALILLNILKFDFYFKSLIKVKINNAMITKFK